MPKQKDNDVNTVLKPKQTKQTQSKAKSSQIKPVQAQFGYAVCKTCDYIGNKASMTRHHQKCTERIENPTQEVYRLRIDGGMPFWLDVDLKAEATLNDLDAFLRGIWLECCGHLSGFSIGPQQDFEFGHPFEEPQQPDQPPVSELLTEKQEFNYTYDFGSSTYLEIKVVAKETVSDFEGDIRLLARNIQVGFRCVDCDQVAEHVHSWEFDEQTGRPRLHCAKHVDEEELDEGAYLPVVNSPRIGVCGYEGGSMDNWPEQLVEEPRG